MRLYEFSPVSICKNVNLESPPDENDPNIDLVASLDSLLTMDVTLHARACWRVTSEKTESDSRENARRMHGVTKCVSVTQVFRDFGKICDGVVNCFASML